MSVRLLLGIASLLTAAGLFAAEPAFLLKGKVATGDAYIFNVKPAGGRAEWLALGETIAGYTLAAFDHPMNTLTLKKDGATIQITMEIAAVGDKVIDPAERRQRDAERMLRMKPALEAGQPIRGNVVMLVNGKAVAQPAEFVIGKETRLDAGEGTTYVVTPTLNADGSVRYQLELTSESAGGAQKQRVRVPGMVATPWGQFSMFVGDHGFGFVPQDDGGS